MKGFLLPTIVFWLLLLSCSNSADESKSVEESALKVDKENSSFKVVNVKKNFFVSKKARLSGKCADYIVEFEMENQTPNKITNFNIEAFFNVVFEDGKAFELPDWYKEVDWNTGKTADGIWPANDINKKQVWLPNTRKKFVFEIPGHPKGDGGMSQAKEMDALKQQYFERTPTSVTVTFKYTAISVDKEYNEEQTFDIIDQWKNFQQELGFR